MSTYLLLRNNKESGPYALDDLVKHGLKAYDLVWVEGKSAAWRYPGEINELKPYAPMVEEQPFDRFFKKTNNEQKEEPVTVAEKPAARADLPIADKYQKYIPKKSVVVTLPAQKKVAVQMPISRPATQVPRPAPAPSSTPTVTVKEQPVTSEVKYFQSLDEIKEMYVKTMQERKGRVAKKAFLTKNLKRAAVIAGLVTIGLLAGFIIKSGLGEKEKAISQKAVPVVPVINDKQVLEDQPQDLPETDMTINKQVLEGVQQHSSTPPEQANDQHLIQKDKALPNNRPALKKEILPASTEKSKEVSQSTIVASKGADKDPVTGERQSVTRDESSEATGGNNTEPMAKAVKKNNWDKIASVSSNDYKRVAFGGIRNLELTVTNDSKHVLDKVIVQVQYLKNSDVPVKTENVEFHSIAPNGGTQTLRMPDTNRGAKISYKIINVEQVQQETASSGL